MYIYIYIYNDYQIHIIIIYMYNVHVPRHHTIQICMRVVKLQMPCASILLEIPSLCIRSYGSHCRLRHICNVCPGGCSNGVMITLASEF